jgi:hypothetical protein
MDIRAVCRYFMYSQKQYRGPIEEILALFGTPQSSTAPSLFFSGSKHSALLASARYALYFL